jgi:hypothetical protein
MEWHCWLDQLISYFSTTITTIYLHEETTHHHSLTFCLCCCLTCHRSAFQQLVSLGVVYPCICSRKDIQALAAPHAGDEVGVTCEVGCEMGVTRNGWACASQTWMLLGTWVGLVGREGARLLLLLLCVVTSLAASCLRSDAGEKGSQTARSE